MIALGYGVLGLALIAALYDAALRLGDRRATRFSDVTGDDDD